MSTLTFEDPVLFEDRGIKQGDAFRRIKPDKSGKIFCFWSEENGQITLVRPDEITYVSVEEFDRLYEPVTQPNQLQDE